ncbi:hypothetical protein MY04_0701 [Flammeovirga sp. MY04]|uniref:hypothetical protein n=1 Tax=Flammeovirga sp. MY04 TaxID=1191459 RepID=UPI0008063364|nr:hypothetical protein [Flammeovirga sp. MY04]ANQ48083.1 hypothetical protein MY04_0701 [Flammeovirga sp. MY04]
MYIKSLLTNKELNLSIVCYFPYENVPFQLKIEDVIFTIKQSTTKIVKEMPYGEFLYKRRKFYLIGDKGDKIKISIFKNMRLLA